MKLEPCPGCGAHLVLQSNEWASPCWEHPFRDGKTECSLVTVVVPNLPEYIAQWDALPRPASGGLEVDVDALADRVANIRQGESDTPRCEPPGQYEIGIAREWVVRVLKALATTPEEKP